MVEGYSEEIGQPHYIHFSESDDLIILYLWHALHGLVESVACASHFVLYSSLRRRPPPPDVREGGAGEGQLPPLRLCFSGFVFFVFLFFTKSSAFQSEGFGLNPPW